VSGNSIERLLDKIDAEISNFLIFAGALDNNAKLLSFRRGKASFSLPIERHDTLDVQLSLLFSLIRQLEDISGPHKFSMTRFARHDIFLFGTQELHVFVITSPTSEGQVAKTLAELAATMSGIESPPIATSTVAGRNNDKSMAAAMTSTATRYDEPAIDRQKFSMAKSKPESAAMLQGYLMALEVDCSIQEDAGGFYKIKVNTKDGKLPWSVLEKMNSTFKNKIDFQNIGTDADGKVYLTISIR
jgi:hypothetical protein